VTSSGSEREGSELIAALALQMLPVEGIWFRETWRNPATTTNGAPLGTAIYGLITNDIDSFSSMHVLEADEIWHFYSGDPLEMLMLQPDGSHSIVVLGPDVVAGGRYCLFGTTMAPGFTPSMFRGGDPDQLSAQWPAAAEHLRRLCRPDAPEHMPDTQACQTEQGTAKSSARRHNEIPIPCGEVRS
jgi:uncharacterized protein